MRHSHIILAAMASTIALSSCGTIGSGLLNGATGSSSSSSTVGSVLGSVLGTATSGETLGNILSSVIGTDKLKTSSLYGTWHYNGPGCAFTSENALAKAGGEVAASTVKEKLATEYSKLGFTASNTYITFNKDNSFSAKIDGKSFSGTYTFDESTQALNLKGLIINLNGYAKKNTNGIAILFESKKVLTLLQTVAAASGNSTLSTIGNISKSYDGVRVGFDLK